MWGREKLIKRLISVDWNTIDKPICSNRIKKISLDIDAAMLEVYLYRHRKSNFGVARNATSNTDLPSEIVHEYFRVWKAQSYTMMFDQLQFAEVSEFTIWFEKVADPFSAYSFTTVNYFGLELTWSICSNATYLVTRALLKD